MQYLDPKSKALYNSKLWVKIHRRKKGPSITSLHGLPKILPISWKEFLRTCKFGIAKGSIPRGQLIKLKLFLTMLSFFRACSPLFRKVDYTSIVQPNRGSASLSIVELRSALKSLGITVIKTGKPSIFFASSKAGPNFPVATLGLG